MKIGLNATCFNDRPSGARQRFIGIYGELIKQMPESEFVIFEPRDCQVAKWFDGLPNVSAQRTPLPSVGRIKRLYSGLGYWNNILTNGQYQVFEGFSLPLIKPLSGRTIITIHDIRRMQSEAGALDRFSFNKIVGKAFEASDHVISVSEAMRKEILENYPGLSVSVIYNGVNINGFETVSEEDKSAVTQKYRLPHQFILAVGHFEQRKNYLRLIDALALLRDRGNAPSLLIVGNDSGSKKTIQDKVLSESLSGHVKILSGLSDLEVRCLYKLCNLFVFPSSYEGFGIPVLESMAAGCPMVLSDIPVFREITQNKGYYFQHDDCHGMASAIEHMLGSSDDRERIVSYGRQRVTDFSFKGIAGNLKDLYSSLL